MVLIAARNISKVYRLGDIDLRALDGGSKCRAVLSVWTEKRKAGEVCREMGVVWGILQQWQVRAMEGMLLALQPRVTVERGVALSPRLAVLLEKKSRAGLLWGIDKRLKRLQKSMPGSQPVPAEKT